MLKPKKTKYRKFQKGYQPKGVSLSRTQLCFGIYGLKALKPAKITSAQIESARKAIVSKTKRLAKIWIRIYPDIAVSKKPAEVRMGKGKGNPEFWISKVQSGTVLFEVDNISPQDAKISLTNASFKLPVQTKIINNLR